MQFSEQRGGASSPERNLWNTCLKNNWNSWGDRGKIKSVFSPIALASWLANLVAKANHKLLMGFFGKGHKDLLLLLRHRESQIIAEEDAFLPGKKKVFQASPLCSLYFGLILSWLIDDRGYICSRRVRCILNEIDLSGLCAKTTFTNRVGNVRFHKCWTTLYIFISNWPSNHQASDPVTRISIWNERVHFSWKQRDHMFMKAYKRWENAKLVLCCIRKPSSFSSFLLLSRPFFYLIDLRNILL